MNAQINWRDQSPAVCNLAAIAIEAYVTWLNGATEDNDYVFTIAHFTDHAANPYADLTITTHYETTDHEVIVLRPYDGDDGGAATITAYFSDGYAEYPPTLDMLMQEFDTYVQVIYDRENVTH
jgi:hypothetical protein